jgi:hypothetical protein
MTNQTPKMTKEKAETGKLENGGTRNEEEERRYSVVRTAFSPSDL